MLELRGMKEYHSKYHEIKGLPIEVQEQIEQTLTMLDESYGEVGERTFEGGKVVVVEGQEDAEYVNTLYVLSNNEFADEVYISDGIYLMVLIIFGTENSIMIIGKQGILQSYL